MIFNFREPPSFTSTLNLACESWSVSKEELLSKGRSEPLPTCRAILANALNVGYGMKAAQIGKLTNQTPSLIDGQLRSHVDRMMITSKREGISLYNDQSYHQNFTHLMEKVDAFKIMKANRL
tara:strand:- start:18563 stop:18928 length:366 start_codon:yes stop_codon:yes gene_type:complete